MLRMLLSTLLFMLSSSLICMFVNGSSLFNVDLPWHIQIVCCYIYHCQFGPNDRCSHIFVLTTKIYNDKKKLISREKNIPMTRTTLGCESSQAHRWRATQGLPMWIRKEMVILGPENCGYYIHPYEPHEQNMCHCCLCSQCCQDL